MPYGDYGPYVRAYRTESIRSRVQIEESDLALIEVLRYGPGASQTIDITVPKGRTDAVPVLVFFHGGYWQELSKHDSFFPAWSAVEQGWAYAAVDYTLAPQVSLDEIVSECRDALNTIRVEAGGLGVDPSRVVVAGSSAGAHLAAMVALAPAVSHAPLAGAVLVSGIYDLEPLIGTSINEALGLDVQSAQRNSPLLENVDAFPPTVLAYGDNETSEFKSQTHRFERHLEAAGIAVSSLCVAGRNHFDVIMDLAEPHSALGSMLTSLIRSGGTDAEV